MEAAHVGTIRLGDASVDTVSAGFERWISVVKKQERLVANRLEELRNGRPPKQKNRTYRIRDGWIKKYIRQYRRCEISLQQYWDKIADIKKDFDIEQKLS